MAASSIPVIEPAVATFFESKRLITPISGNKRSISTGIISPPGSGSSSSSHTSSLSCLTADDFSAKFDYIRANILEIPASLESIESYQYMGFTEQNAREMWDRHIKTPSDMDPDFLDMALFAIGQPGHDDSLAASDDWDGNMQRKGIAKELRDAILMPEFEDLRHTASCNQWLREAVEVRYWTLKTMNERARHEQIRQQRRQKDEKRANVISSVPSSEIADGKKRKSVQEVDLPPVSKASGSKEVDKPPSTWRNAAAPQVADVQAPRRIHGSTMVWRAMSRVHLDDSIDQQSGVIRGGPLASHAPGDFSGGSAVIYLTPQKETADRYAKWQKHKYKDTDIFIVQFEVENEWIETIGYKYFWSTDKDWREVVWKSRNRRNLTGHLEKYSQAPMLIGHISSGVHIKYQGYSPPADIKDSDILKVDINMVEQFAIQWAIMTSTAQESFAEVCRDKFWIFSMGTFRKSTSLYFF